MLMFTLWFLPVTTNLIMAALTFMSLAAPRTAQQAKERVVKIITLRDQPIDIIAVRVKGDPVEADREFKGDSDWFNGLTVTIKNVSNRPIVFATVLVTAPHEKNGVRNRKAICRLQPAPCITRGRLQAFAAPVTMVDSLLAL
jgi:hypothetical protein